MQVVVVTGMSGSGKSTVMDVMEDIGYYCIDNLPPQLIHRFVEICRSRKTAGKNRNCCGFTVRRNVCGCL
ncbi:MAG: RNase adapter RapZ [Ruminococcus sp.]